MIGLPAIRQRTRQLLADTEFDIWSESDLDEAVSQALEIYSRERPYQDAVTVVVTEAVISAGTTVVVDGEWAVAPSSVPAEAVIPAGTVVVVDGEWVIGRRGATRELNLSFLSNSIIDVVAVWCPFPEFPPSEKAFSYWPDLQTLRLVNYELDIGEVARVFYTRLHTLDENATSVPQRDHGLLALGGAAFAATSRAVDIAERRGDIDVAITQQVRAWGASQMRRFVGELSKPTSADVAGGFVDFGLIDRFEGRWA